MKIMTLIIFLTSVTAFAEVVVLHETKEDLNKDGKKDSIAWVADSKEAKRPKRLVIRMPGRTLLDLAGNFCAPKEKAPDCTDLSVVKRLSPRKEPLLIFTSGKAVYTYRWKHGDYHIYRASFIGGGEKYDINYDSGVALVTSSKATQTCPLKNPRKGETISHFTLYNINEETSCP